VEYLAWHQRGLDAARALKQTKDEGTLLNNIGLVYNNLGERRRALEYYEQALPIHREVGNRAVEATTLNNIGMVYDALGECRRALEYFEQALTIVREVGDRANEAKRAQQHSVGCCTTPWASTAARSNTMSRR